MASPPIHPFPKLPEFSESCGLQLASEPTALGRARVPRRRVIPRESQAHVRRRAQYLCEYCHTAEQWQYVPFTVDHVLPLAQGGN